MSEHLADMEERMATCGICGKYIEGSGENWICDHKPTSENKVEKCPKCGHEDIHDMTILESKAIICRHKGCACPGIQSTPADKVEKLRMCVKCKKYPAENPFIECEFCMGISKLDELNCWHCKQPKDAHHKSGACLPLGNPHTYFEPEKPTPQSEGPYRVIQNDAGAEGPDNEYWFEIVDQNCHLTDICFELEEDAERVCNLLNSKVKGQQSLRATKHVCKEQHFAKEVLKLQAELSKYEKSGEGPWIPETALDDLRAELEVMKAQRDVMGDKVNEFIEKVKKSEADLTKQKKQEQLWRKEWESISEVAKKQKERWEKLKIKLEALYQVAEKAGDDDQGCYAELIEFMDKL